MSLADTYGTSPSYASVENALSVLKNANLASGFNRAMFFSRSEMSVEQSQNDLKFISENERIILDCLKLLNANQGWDMELNKIPPPYIMPYQCLASMQVGAAIDALGKIIDYPLMVEFRDQLWRAGSIAENSALINEISSVFAKLASGNVWFAGHSAAPNTFFRCQEHRDLMNNQNVRGVNLVFRNPSDPNLLITKYFKKEDWNIIQREQWWRYSTSLLITTQNKIPAIAAARFIGELFQIVSEIDIIQNGKQIANPNQKIALSHEYQRLKEAQVILSKHAELANPVNSLEIANSLVKMFVHNLPANAAEREYVLGKKFCAPSLDFVNDQIRILLIKADEYSRICA